VLFNLNRRLCWQIISDLIPIANAKTSDSLDKKELFFGSPIDSKKRGRAGMDKIEIVGEFVRRGISGVRKTENALTPVGASGAANVKAIFELG
jgi:hypothetical protein